MGIRDSRKCSPLVFFPTRYRKGDIIDGRIIIRYTIDSERSIGDVGNLIKQTDLQNVTMPALWKKSHGAPD